MMGWNYGGGTSNVPAAFDGGGMMGVASGWSVFGTLYAVVILVDLVFLGLWLWKQIAKGK